MRRMLSCCSRSWSLIGGDPRRRARRRRRPAPGLGRSWSKPRRARSSSRPIRTKRRRPWRTSSALINKRFYNGQRVHRVVPGFVMQFGDQQTRDMTKEKMWGRVAGPADRRRGVLEAAHARQRARSRMAHNGDASKADTQMYVTLADTPRLDGKYVVFGKVISGMDVVEKMQVRRSDRQSNRARGKVATIPARSGKRSTISAGIRAVTGSSSIFFSVTAFGDRLRGEVVVQEQVGLLHHRARRRAPSARSAPAPSR